MRMQGVYTNIANIYVNFNALHHAFDIQHVDLT